MPTPTSAVKVNPVTGALIDPPVATFAAINGLLTSGSADAKNSVRVATTTNGTLATAYENGDTIDGIVLATSDRILIKNQSAPAENGIYTINASGAPTRATDFDAWDEIIGAFVSVESGTVNAGTQWLCNVAAGGTLGVTAITFVVPKNYVDLTTNQTVGGIKTFTLAPVFTDASGTRTALGLAIGTNVQAYDADLTTWAGITPGANVGTALAIAAGSSGGIKLAKPFAAARKAATQSFSSGANQTLEFTTAVGGDALTTGNTIFTATLAGVVLVTFSCRVYSSVAIGDPLSTTLLLSVQGSGTAVDAYSAYPAAIIDPLLAVNALVSFTIPVAVTANQTLKIVMNVDTAGADTIEVSDAFVSYSYLN